MSYFDSSEDELRDEEYPDEDDIDEETETIVCPACGADVYEDSEHCPGCGEYMARSTSPWAGRSAVFVILGLAGILATLWVLMMLG